MGKRMEEAVVLSQTEIAPGIFDLTLQAEAAKESLAGQFVNLFPDDGTHLLARPVSVCGADRENGILRLCYRVLRKDSGTAVFAEKKEGETIRLLGPLGNGYFSAFEKSEKDLLKNSETFLLVGGGVGIFPLFQLAKDLSAKGKTVQAVLGYRDSDNFLAGDFRSCSDVWEASQDGSVGTKGTVLDILQREIFSPDVLCACGPSAMLKEVKKWAELSRIPCFFSLEEKMACGIGACLSCVVPSAGTDPETNVCYKRVCKDGPVFSSKEVRL